MELREFVAAALLDIIGGVQDAQNKVTEATIVPPMGDNIRLTEKGFGRRQTIEFEVAVRTEETDQAQAKLSVVAGLLGGNVAGGTTSSQNYAAKLSFRIPVVLPVKLGASGTSDQRGAALFGSAPIKGTRSRG